MENILCIKEAATLLRLSKGSVYQLIYNGTLPDRRLPPVTPGAKQGKRVLFDSDLEGLLEGMKPHREPMKLKHIGR